ncbi:MAG: PepSY-like domain-containing protein [Cytophagales bacterium]|nr:PepSY-like domain-containing protein [Cytophagales bacterium]
MRKILLSLVTALLQATQLQAQDLAAKDVPAAVTSGFKTKFPDAADVKWKKNKSGKYEADFRLSGKKAEAKFLADGKWDSSERRVDAAQLPAPAGDYIKKNYAAYEIDWVKWQEEADAAKNRYEVKIKKDKADVELVFDDKGKFLKKKEKDKKAA